jgi:hypothetical protein
MSETFVAEVTQFLRPNGRQKLAHTDLPKDCEANYQAMIAARCRLEAEVLINGVVSMTISNWENDLDMELHPNGPGLQEAIAKMINRKAWEKGKK